MRKRKLLSLLVAAMVMIGGSAWAGDKTVVSYSFDDVNSPAVTAGSRVSLDYTRTSVITSTKFLNAWNNTNGDPAASTISLGSTDLSAETWTLSFEWAAVGGCNSKADHTTLKAGDTNLFDLSGNSNWNTTVTLSVAGAATATTLPVPGCDKGKRFTANTGDQMNTTAYWHHIVVTGSSDGVKLTITNSSTGNAIVTDVVLSETNVNPTSLIIEPCCGGAIGIDELSLSYYVEGEVIQTPLAAYTKVDGINRTITATCATEGATLYYSTDGENWTEGASVIVNTSGNVYFKAVKGTSESDVLTFAAEAGTEIVLNAPTIARNANGTVTISADQSKLLLAPTATIYYTYGEENGSFTGSKELTVAADATITAYAEAEGYAKSADATRAVALFPEDVNTLFSVAAATKGWSENTFSEETITASERTYATLLLDDAAWSENVLLQTNGAWGLRASGNWYINSNTDNSWLLVKDAKAGNIVVVDATFAPAETVNATYTEKYSFGTKHAYIINADGNAEFALIKPAANEMDYLYGVYGYSLMNEALVVAKEALQTAIAIATNINPEGLADAIAAAQAALTAEGATAESMAQAAQTLEAAIKTYFGEVLPNLGAIVTALNEETLNTAYAAAQELLAKESITPEELATAMQNIITAAQAVAPEHLQNLRGYAVKYGAEDAASLITLIDNALSAIEDGNVAQIISTMTAVKEAATPLAQTVLGTMKNYVEAFGLTEQAAQAQAALEGGNYITMITTAKALFTHLIAAAKEYLPKLGDIAEGLNDETLNTAYAAAQELLAKESITPEELGAAMQNIIVAAKAVAPEHLQNLKGYAVKYGATDAATLIDNALAAIEAGNVAQIIATMTAVKEAATPLAQTVLGTMKNYVEAFGLTEQAAQAQAALEGGNYITMITTAKALFTHLIAAAKDYLPKLGAIAEGLNDETLNTAYAAAQELLAKESITPEELATAMQNIITAAQAVAPEHLQNLKGYAEKYGATDAATLIDAALEAIESGNVSQIIATMTAVKEAATPLANQVLGTMINYVQAFGLTEQAAQAQAALEGGNYITMITTAKALFTHLIAAAKDYLPKLGAIAEGLNDETLNTAYAAAQELLAKESITPEELGAAMQNIIVAAKAVAPEHLQNLKGYAVKYGATDAATLIDNALAAIEAGNVSQIIATMTAVKEAATPLAQTVLGTMKNYVEAFGLTEQAAQAQAALEGGNYITMITTAKALFTHLIAAAKDYLPKLGAIAEGLNDETLNTAYAAAQELLAKESITPEELATAMQNIITAAQAVAPEHLQNLRGYAVKYGQDGTATLVDNALAAIEAGNVSQIIATMTAVKEAATPLASSILTQIIGYAQNYDGFADDVTAAQAVLEGGNYITMITTAKALYDKLIAAANDYVASAKAIPTEGKVGVDDLNAAILAAEQALAALDSDFGAINTAIANLVAAVKAFNDANKPAPAEGISYSWESPAGEVIEAGGTIAYVNGDGDRLNYKNGDYYTICLNGKKDNLDDETASANAGHMVITLDNALQEGDAIAMTAYVNKNESKKASAYIVFENGTKMEGEVYSDEANINPAFNGVPTTKVMDVPATAAGSKTITLTRSQTGTNLFITKLVIAQKGNLPTGISTVKSNDRLNGTIYNLNGQKVNMAQKGLYIVNGKKVIVK